MNVLAASLAKRVAADYSTKEKPRWVAGSMGPGRNCRRSVISRSPISGRPTPNKCAGCLMVERIY